MKRNILVTGGAGFVGSHLVDKLIKEGHKVIVVDNLSTGKKENLNNQAEFYNNDILDPEIKDIFEKEKPGVVFHCAAQINLRDSIEDPLGDAKVNILGSLNIIQNLAGINSDLKKDPKFIFTSTGGAMYSEATTIPTPESCPESPLSPYGVAKLAVEKYLNYYYKVFKIPFISLRLANVYGPRQNSKGEAGVMAIFCDKIFSGEQPVIYGDGTQTRDFVYVKDVVKAGLLAMKSEKTGIYNIGTGEETNINTIFEKIKKITGSDFEKKYRPLKSGEQERSCLDCSKAQKELNWEPEYILRSGLEKTVKWFSDKLQ